MKIFVCAACGKTSATRNGTDRQCTRGWDVSCSLNAVELDDPVFVEPKDWKPWDRVTRIERREPQEYSA